MGDSGTNSLRDEKLVSDEQEDTGRDTQRVSRKKWEEDHRRSTEEMPEAGERGRLWGSEQLVASEEQSRDPLYNG